MVMCVRAGAFFYRSMSYRTESQAIAAAWIECVRLVAACQRWWRIFSLFLFFVWLPSSARHAGVWMCVCFAACRTAMYICMLYVVCACRCLPDLSHASISAASLCVPGCTSHIVVRFILNQYSVNRYDDMMLCCVRHSSLGIPILSTREWSNSYES